LFQLTILLEATSMAEPKGTSVLTHLNSVTNKTLPLALSSTLTKLSLNPIPSKSSSSFAKKQKAPPADSWEEEAEDSGSDTEGPLSPQQSNDYPSAPPPTPISPNHNQAHSFENPYGYVDGASERPSGRGGLSDGKRPEKTDAVAKRLIAGALGVRAPKKTDDQKAYEKAAREKEVKRREKEKADEVKAKQEKERAKAAVWEE
jgi:hypothetical protein